MSPRDSTPEGSLTRAQYEILRAIWTVGGQGATVAEIWGVVSETRDVARTTVLNLVDRLEKRGWLTHSRDGGIRRYRSVTSREATEQHLVDEVVTDYFSGSAVDLVSRLLGSRRLRAADRRRLAELLEESAPKRKNPKRRES